MRQLLSSLVEEATTASPRTYVTTWTDIGNLDLTLQERLAGQAPVGVTTNNQTHGAELAQRRGETSTNTTLLVTGASAELAMPQQELRLGTILSTYDQSSWQSEAAPYLRDLIQEGWIENSIIGYINSALQQMRYIAPYLGAPNIGPTETGHVLITWKNAQKHFEVEVLPTGELELFYKDRAGDQLWLLDSHFPLLPKQVEEASGVLQQFST